MKPMTKEQYLQIQMSIFQVAKTIGSLDLEGFIAQIEAAELITPTLDPTIWVKAQENLKHVKNLAQSLLPVKSAFDETFQAIIKGAASKVVAEQLLAKNKSPQVKTNE